MLYYIWDKILILMESENSEDNIDFIDDLSSTDIEWLLVEGVILEDVDLAKAMMDILTYKLY